MLNVTDIIETINMIHEENLDIRTITMGISLIDCAGDDIDRVCERVYDKITTPCRAGSAASETILKRNMAFR